MTVYRRCRFLIVAAAAAAAVLAYFVSSEVESRLVRKRVEALMAPAANDMREEMLAGADPILYYLANCIQRDLPTVAAAASSLQKVTALMRTYALDEINFADTNGVIRATTHPSQLNYWMGTDPDPGKAAGFRSRRAVPCAPTAPTASSPASACRTAISSSASTSRAFRRS